jgi:hypothetical protein
MNKYIGTKTETRFTKYRGGNSKVSPLILDVAAFMVFSLLANLTSNEIRVLIRALQSPMDKQICHMYAQTNVESSRFRWDIGLIRWDIGSMRMTFYNPMDRESEYCRYIN